MGLMLLFQLFLNVWISPRVSPQASPGGHRQSILSVSFISCLRLSVGQKSTYNFHEQCSLLLPTWDLSEARQSPVLLAAPKHTRSLQIKAALFSSWWGEGIGNPTASSPDPDMHWQKGKVEHKLHMPQNFPQFQMWFLLGVFGCCRSFYCFLELF